MRVRKRGRNWGGGGQGERLYIGDASIDVFGREDTRSPIVWAPQSTQRSQSEAAGDPLINTQLAKEDFIEAWGVFRWKGVGQPKLSLDRSGHRAILILVPLHA